jgi:UDP-glucose 4-epimerase
MPTLIKPDIKKLSGARALVTGGAGLIGSHVVERLLAAEAAEVIVIDNLSRGRLATLSEAMATGRVTFVEGDIRDRALLERTFAGIDLVFHLAAIRLTHAAEVPRLALEVMADGTFNVLEAAVNARVPRVVAASSASIYGMAHAFPTSEEHHPYNNDTIYGAAKAFNEGLLASFRAMYQLDYVALRPFNVYGPRMDVQGVYTEVLVRWIDRISRGQPPIIFGDGQQTMDWVYVDDVARAFLLSAASDESGMAFNVASGVETSLNELAQELIRATGATMSVEYGPARTVNAVSRRVADTRLARERLGFTAETSLGQGLSRLVAWWRQTQPTGPRP